jgi:hypothetical protein
MLAETGKGSAKSDGQSPGIKKKPETIRKQREITK